MVIKSAYSARNQKNGSFDDWVFVTRHSANCTFSTIEESAIPLLGYLPQDLENTDVFSHYHPDDLQYLKGVYENILVKQVRNSAFFGRRVVLNRKYKCLLICTLGKTFQIEALQIQDPERRLYSVGNSLVLLH